MQRKNKGGRGSLSKRAAMGIFYTLAAILLFVVLSHHNPLADQTTEMMKKIMAVMMVIPHLMVIHNDSLNHHFF